MSTPNLDINFPYQYGSQSTKDVRQTICEICKEPLEGNWCTANVCEDCCRTGKCPMKERCRVYPNIEKIFVPDQIILNPSRRIKIE